MLHGRPVAILGGVRIPFCKQNTAYSDVGNLGMMGDLREKLTTVGRLDLMRSVDDKATKYFATLDPRDLSDHTLEQQARSLTGIGQVRLEEGNHPAAAAAFAEAYDRTRALYDRKPSDGQRLFDRAQAEYWIGYVAWQQDRFDEAEKWLTRYRDSALKLAPMHSCAASITTPTPSGLRARWMQLATWAVIFSCTWNRRA